MRRNISLAIAIFVAASLLTIAAAEAGVVIIIADTDPGSGPANETKAFLEPAQVKMENSGGGIIFRDGSRTFIRYSDRDQTYTEMTPEAMKAIQARSLASMQEQMAKMPEEQRKKMEAILERQGMGPSAAAPMTITYNKIASRQTVGSWRCDQFEELADGKKVAELCIARLEDLGLTEGDLAAFRSLAKAVADLGPRIARQRSARYDLDAMKAQIGFAGLPVRTVEISDDLQRHEAVVKSITRQDLPPATFEVPASYARKDLVLRQPGQ